MYDILIKNAVIIDGSGQGQFSADVAVSEGKIHIVHGPVSASEIIDASGLYLCPGFIDAHSHGDGVFGQYSGQLCKTSQGVTTEIVGQCGLSLFPVSPGKEALLAQVNGATSRSVPEEMKSFTTFDSYRRYVESRRLTTNCAQLVGHCALRIAAMGFDDRAPSAAEMNVMKSLLRACMESGAAGLSSGLIYPPSCYAKVDELAELCSVVAEYGGLYTTHMRNEAAGVLDSVNESIEAARLSGVCLDISHHKICGHDNWQRSRQTLEAIDRALDEGVSVFLDVYPYSASMTSLAICLPPRCFTHGMDGMKSLIGDATQRKAIAQEMEIMDGRYRHCGGFKGIMIAGSPSFPDAEGKRIQDYAEELGKSPLDVFFDILEADGSDVTAIYFSMSDEDLFRIVSHPRSVIGSDGIVRSLEEKAHPRGFGTFPRCIHTFVKEKKILTLEAMIRKMTGLPAELLGLKRKGLVADGYDADLLLFDYDRIRDVGDYKSPLRKAEGIERVFVAGKEVYKGKELTGEYPGKLLLRGKDLN